MARARGEITLEGQPVPARWWIGGFEIEIAELVRGVPDPNARLIRKLAGKAWLRLPCARPPIRPLGPFLGAPLGSATPPDPSRLTHTVEVVADVLHPQTQIALADARQLRPGAAVGDTIALDLALGRTDLQDIVDLRRGLPDWLGSEQRGTWPMVEFSDLTLSLDEAAQGIGRVIDGAVTFPIAGMVRRPIEVVVDGFVLVLSALDLAPRKASALAQARLPGTIADPASCGPVTIELGRVGISPKCDVYVDAPERAYGPWLLGDTGMVVEGTGYVLDLSTAASPPPRPAAWRGLLLGAGRASGEQYVPDPCNTGYLRGHYTYAEAVVIGAGFFASLQLAEPLAFGAINPLGQTLAFQEGTIDIAYGQVAKGELKNGWTELPPDAVCEGVPGRRVRTPVEVLSIQPDLDLAGAVDHGNREISWGELTRHGDEVVAWTGIFGPGNLYLPAGAHASFSPVATGTFSGLAIGTVRDTSLAELEGRRVAGVSFPQLVQALVFSPDRPGARTNPIGLNFLQGWLRVGVSGVDGALSTYAQAQDEELGDPAGTGYAGRLPLRATLFANDRKNLLAEFVTSAAHDSHFGGRFAIPAPCQIPRLDFAEIKLTSTACFVGGEVVLPSTGVPLAYWKLQLVPTGPPDHAGVVSVRTGRLLLSAAGIAEPLHFARPFGLTWGEMLADGNLGELYLDFNNWGQRFDGLVFNPDELVLSDYDAAVADPYLGVSGQVCFPFFRQHGVNIRDALAYTGAPPAPTRHVTVPKAPITPRAAPTALALAGTWHDIATNELAVFDCAEARVDYNVPAQRGFFGTGTSRLAFLHSDPLDITVEIHSDATDIHISSTVSHDIDLGLFARIGGLGQIAGCARIEGPTLSRITLFGSLEHSATTGSIFSPKAGFAAEINIAVTPTSFDFYASGDMLLSAVVDLEASATVHLRHDFLLGAAEGELYGRVDCDAVVTGLSGEGQLTWHIDPAMQYLQGRLKVAVISPIVSGGLEGGFFIGNNVPKALAWVLDPTDTHFGMSRSILPATLTGVYGYGQASMGFNAYVLGGGVELFAGAGAFSAPIASGGPLAPFSGSARLPYVVGACGIHVHGEILGGLVSASAWANLSLRGPVPTYFEGTFGLRGCVAWVLCASTDLTAGVNSAGFYLN